MNDKEIEQQIQAKGLTAPRVTPDDIEGNIKSEYYFTAAEGSMASIWITGTAPRSGTVVGVADLIPKELDLLTFCVLVLQNGFTVTGESACASPGNFNAEIGQQIARSNAINKIWPLMGYELKQRLHKGQ